jgi:hypothetical protein
MFLIDTRTSAAWRQRHSDRQSDEVIVEIYHCAGYGLAPTTSWHSKRFNSLHPLYPTLVDNLMHTLFYFIIAPVMVSCRPLHDHGPSQRMDTERQWEREGNGYGNGHENQMGKDNQIPTEIK